MNILKFRINKCKSFIKITTACFLILINGLNLFAQYRGAPVKQDRLIKVLRSKQLQTRDIISIINSNGVDFSLTPDVRKALIAAGARPEIIKAIENNRRSAPNEGSILANNDFKKIIIEIDPPAPDYNELIERAIHTYKEQDNPKNAVRYLETAIKMKPKNAKAYQIMGFVNLYGLNNLPEAQKFMRESIINGGSAVFRVYHNHKGNSLERSCAGSLYVSPEKIRFESDDNVHTFETLTANVEKIKVDRESSKTRKTSPLFKVFLKLGKGKTNFRFAPISGKEDESNMVAQFVQEAKIQTKPSNVAMNFLSDF